MSERERPQRRHPSVARHERKAMHEHRMRELRVLIHDHGMPVDVALDDEELRRWR